MDLKEFADRAKKTSTYYGANVGGVYELSYLGLGLAGEAGEVANALRKLCEYHNKGSGAFDSAYFLEQNIIDELGDVLWFLVRLCDIFHIDLDVLAQRCDHKLTEKYPDLFRQLSKTSEE